MQELENGPADEVPDQKFEVEEAKARVEPVDTIDEVSGLFFQVPANQRIESQAKNSDDPQKDHSDQQRHLVSEIEGEGHPQMAEANVHKVRDVPLEQRLHDGALDEIVLPPQFAYLVRTCYFEDYEKQDTGSNIHRYCIDEESEHRVQQHTGGLLDLHVLLPGEGFVIRHKQFGFEFLEIDEPVHDIKL